MKFTLSYLAFILLITGCAIDDDVPVEPPCFDVDLGLLEINPPTLDFVNYFSEDNLLNSKQYIYKNEAGVEVALKFDDPTIFENTTSRSFIGPCPVSPSKNISFNYQSDYKALYGRIEELEYEFKFELRTNADPDNLDAESYIDDLTISGDYYDNGSASHDLLFGITVNQKNSNYHLHLPQVLHEDYVIFGNEFSNVYQYEANDDWQDNTIRYNHEFGIVVFKDWQDTRWVFDRIE